MKLFYLLIALILIGCQNPEANTDSPPSDRMELIPEPDKDLREKYEKAMANDSQQINPIPCASKANDFLKLKDKALQKEFFFMLDSIRKVQYPDNDQELTIMVDLTPEYLNKFLTDLNKDSLRLNNTFEKEYHFNIAPKGYTDPKVCKDKIQITFDEEYCSFRMVIYNTFFVEPNWCTESTIVYTFRIEEDRIIDFGRNEAG